MFEKRARVLSRLYEWVSNGSENTKVWFDDFSVSHTSNFLTQATDYGAWGDVLREQKTDESIYRYSYQGQYAEKDVETGWNHFELREFDAVIGRSITVDPARQFNAPYVWVGNNPVNGVDPTGGMSPIYDLDGNFLGTDNQGLQGEAIFMNASHFTQGMSYESALEARFTFSQMGQVVSDRKKDLPISAPLAQLGFSAMRISFPYDYAFASSQEEIEFFKEQKPVLLSQYLFYKKSLSVFLCDSYKDNESKKIYYISVLDALSVFLRKNSPFHLYCLTGQTHLDHIYFSRGTRPFQGVFDPKFSTGYDIRLAKLLANELLRNELSMRVDKLSTKTKTSGLRWTGKKSDAVELLFALQSSGSINNGEVDVKKLAAAFEDLFNFQFGNYYDFIKKIRMRKGNQANYLDVLKATLLQRLREMDD